MLKDANLERLINAQAWIKVPAGNDELEDQATGKCRKVRGDSVLGQDRKTWLTNG
jgi:hypothetical protein